MGNQPVVKAQIDLRPRAVQKVGNGGDYRVIVQIFTVFVHNAGACVEEEI